MPQHSHITLPSGITLHVVEEGPQDGKLLIFLHGFPEFWYGWRHQISYFAQQGYHVVVPDQRGYNLSDKPKSVADYSLDKLSEDVVALIDHFKKQKAVIVGHDWGGVVAWWTAFRFKKRVEKNIILNVPHPRVMQKYLATDPTQTLRSWYILFFQLPFLPEKMMTFVGPQSLRQSSRAGTFTDTDLEFYQKAWSQPGALTGMINWYRAGLRHPPKKLGTERITVPTLLIWGKKDAFLKHQMAQPSVDLCDTGKLVYLENASHWVAHEEPQEVNRLIQEFIG